jgi:hypothetical protein
LITLSWNEVKRAGRYELKRLAGEVACAGDAVQATVTDDQIAQTFTHTFTAGIEASKHYTLCVRAANAQGPSAWASTPVTTLVECTLTLTAGAGGSVSGGGSGACNRNVTITATPDAGYRFTGWSGGITGTENPKTFTLRSDLAVSASFGRVPPPTCSLTLTAGAGGSVSGGGSGACGWSATLRATPSVGYVFSHWSAGVSGTENPKTITVSSNLSAHANFTYVPPPPTCDPDTKPDTSDTITTTETGTEYDGPAERPRTRSVTQKWVRSITCGSNGAWVEGEWEKDGDPTKGEWVPGSWTCTPPIPARPAPVTKPRTISTTTVWVVSGGVAKKQQTVTTRVDTNVFKWTGAKDCEWIDDWKQGSPTSETKTLETKNRPPTRTWTTRVNEALTGRTRVVRVQTTPVCLEQRQEQLRYRIRYSAQAYVWSDSKTWVLGPVTRTTPPVWHTRWRDVGSQRLCTLGGQEEETPATDAGPTFGAGQHTLQWGAVWLRFTVPADASVLLAARADATGELTMVFSLARGAELVVSPSALARGERPTSADPTLASLAASLTVVEEPEDVSAEPGDAVCATATPGTSTEPTRVDLNATDCTLISGGGAVRLAAGEASLSLTLPEGGEWIAFAAPSPQDGARDAFWLVDARSGSMFVLDPASGSELARQLTAGAADLGSLFDGIAGSAVAGG